MTFNEQNTVEHFIIHQLTRVNLNAVQGNIAKKDAIDYDTVQWKYIQADLLQRDTTEVFVEKELKAALLPDKSCFLPCISNSAEVVC